MFWSPGDEWGQPLETCIEWERCRITSCNEATPHRCLCHWLRLVSMCGSALPPDWAPSKRRTGKRRPAPRRPRGPTLPPLGTTGAKASGAATARPADWTTARARRGTMYVLSSILLPHPHTLHPPPSPTPAPTIYIGHSLYRCVWSCSFCVGWH